MANLKYPSAFKAKSPLAWLGGIITGLTPLFWFYPHLLIREHYTGNNPRHIYNEERL